MKWLWKTVRATPAYRYEQHRITGQRRAVKLQDMARPPQHKDWLQGGDFKANKKKKAA
jgi:hypothetical protein